MLPTDRNFERHGGKKGAKKMKGGIWIRSQDGNTLAFVDVVEYAKYGAERKQKNVIIGNRVMDLGVYRTDKRALEILKDIQEGILRKSKIYEMPKE